jgi:hypothetical protein
VAGDFDEMRTRGYCRRVVAAASLAPLALAMLSVAVDVTARPEDTRCPSRAALTAALQGRVPEQAVRWSVRYRVETPADLSGENHVWLELRDGEGELRLRRELVVTDDGCEAAADGIALIVGRFFREVSWTGAVPLPDMERAPEPPPAPAASGRPWELQGGLALRREVTLSPGLVVQARVPIARAWLVDAGVVLLPLPPMQVVGPGSARLWSLPVRVSVRRMFARGPLGLDFGPQVTGAWERAVTSGLRDGAGDRLLVAVGAASSARWAFARAWTFALDFALEVAVVAPSFQVTTVTGAPVILAPQRVQVSGVAGVARRF